MLSRQSSDIAIRSSCYSSETEDSLKCAKGVWCIIEKTEMLSSLIKIDYKINFKKEEQTSQESGMWFSVQPLGWVLIVVNFSIGNGTIALRRILKT